jgi:hypothetical protein
MPEIDTRLGQPTKGQKLTALRDLTAYLRQSRARLEASIAVEVNAPNALADIAAGLSLQVVQQLPPESLPDPWTVEGYSVAPSGAITLRLKRGTGYSVIAYSQAVGEFVTEPKAWLSEQLAGVRKALAKKAAFQADRDRAAKEVADKAALEKAMAFIEADSRLHPTVQQVRHRMTDYAAKLKAAAQMVKAAT